MEYDVAIIGGGLSGSRVATALRRLAPTANVVILERGAFVEAPEGCEACAGSDVVIVRTIEDRVDAVRVLGNRPRFADEEGWVSARYFVDASGQPSVFHELVQEATVASVSRVAIWGNWRIPVWPAKWPKVGTTQICDGSLWLIAQSAQTVSVGFVLSDRDYVMSDLTRAELYAQAIHSDLRASKLLAVSEQEGELWVSGGNKAGPCRTVGENWVMVGASAGFADPIQELGMNLAMLAANEAASMLSASLRGGNQPKLRARLEASNRKRLAEFDKLESTRTRAYVES